ncbi:unnamed protein product, partial [Mesorhabditis spiculigera]
MSVTDDDCPICTQKMLLPTAVDGCGHKFCFLCIKGVALSVIAAPLCPMCRGPLNPAQFRKVVDKHLLIDMSDPEGDDDDGPSQPKRAKPSPEKEKDKRPESPEAGTSQVAMAQKSKAKTAFWLYRARGNGWWRFDPRTEKDIEAARAADQGKCEVMTCGVLYVIDLLNMKQYRKDSSHIQREIVRVEGDVELNRYDIRGLAGVSIK